MEALLQFVWQHRLALRPDMQTVDHRKVRVIHPGTLNTDAGPDFFNATIEIDGQQWAGNVEIHVRASDWFRHHHDTDPAYDSVVLHVVQIDDAPVHRRNGNLIPQIVINCTPDAARRCNRLMEYSAASLPCASTIEKLPRLYHTDWLTSLGAERLLEKSEHILTIVKETGGHWEGAAYITLARALGFGLNSLPFETVARNLPLQFLNRHRDELLTTEAFLFGQAGLIPQPHPGEDAYIQALRREYTFMAAKFSLRPLTLQWKMARTRPQNLPHRRMAALAEKIHQGFHLVGTLHDAATLDDMRRELAVELHGYWATHFTFSGESAHTPRALGKSSIDTLIINVAIPLRLAYAIYQGDTTALTSNIELLEQLEPENNSVTRIFADTGLDISDAFRSQALIQLRREYCEKRKCIYCRFGHKMLSAEIQR